MSTAVNLILLEPDEINADGTARLTGPRAEHIVHVLRATSDVSVRVGVLDGGTGLGRVTLGADGSVKLACELDAGVPSRPAVDLLLAVPRPKVMRRLWAQLAALGLGRIILTNAARVERNYFDTHVLSEACYRPLLVEGLQQARDTRVPQVTIRRRFKVLIEDELDALFPGGLRVVAEPAAEISLTDALRDGARGRVLLAIGPEGGWTAFELDLLVAHGFQAVGIGPRTLRTDTACIALLALAHDALSAASPPPTRGSE
jgi:16S rRNA (uracil1498-N3)-methyltransferase